MGLHLHQPATTKENHKGHTRSYNHRRKIIIAIFLLTSASIIIRKLFARSSNTLKLNLHSKKVGTISNRPIHNIDYGVQSTTPVVMIRSSLDEKLLQRFLQEHLYSCSEEGLNNRDNFPSLDNRVIPPVYVYEGYYHSLPTAKNVYSKNPNPLIGKDFDKPSASPFTRAFYDAFRIVNEEVFDRLKRELLLASSSLASSSSSFNFNNSTTKEEADDDVCYLLAKWIEKGFHFGDLSVQIHYGRGNEDKLTSGRAWHTDAENSLLHLAVTLRGSRVLHSMRVQQHSIKNANAKNSTLRHNRQYISNQEKQRQRRQQLPPTEVLEKQTSGDVYLSSSTLMRHAPQFFDTDYSTRVIAIHARFLYTSADIDHFRRVRTRDSWEKLTNVLADTLAVADIQIPSLEQVESRLSLLLS